MAADDPLALTRFSRLLDAYGAAPERWPDAEREPARRLLAASAPARALWKEAAALDGLLDRAPVPPPPSATVRAAVLATAPRRRHRWPQAVAAAVPLAAAAALVLWLTRGSDRPAPLAEIPVASLGQYTSPTDVLLGSYGADVYATVPAVGCSDSSLGCPRVDTADEPYSSRGLGAELRA